MDVACDCHPTGLVHVFVWSQQNKWLQQAKLEPFDKLDYSTPLFASSIALSYNGHTVMIGCPSYTYNGVFGVGSDYLSQCNSSNIWEAKAYLVTPDAKLHLQLWTGHDIHHCRWTVCRNKCTGP